MRKSLLIPTLCVVLAAAGNAYAHGEASHGQTADASRVSAAVKAAVKEQKPWGIAGEASAVSRSVTIRMTDAMRFSPDDIRVKRGETVRFVLQNDGAMLHEMVIGTQAVLDKHAELMQRFPDMEHDEPWMAHVAPGGQGEIVWHFNRAGAFDFACLIPGHYQAGMKGRLIVR